MNLREPILRLFHSLHFKVASGVIGTVLAISAVHFALDYHFYRTKLMAELRQSSESVSDVTLNSLLELAMVGRHPEMLQGGVERLSRSSDLVRTIQIIDLEGVVRFSSDKSLVGVQASLKGPGCAECHADSAAPPRSAFIELGEEQLLRYAAPIPNRRGCHSCHDPSKPLVGILLVDHSTSAVQENLRASFAEMIIKAGTTVLAILVVLGILMNRIVISRIKRLTGATSLIASKSPAVLDLGNVDGRDEIDQLARSFQQMNEELRTYLGELEEKERIRVSLLKQLVRSQEEERKTISRELHDQLGQSLSALLLEFQTRFSDPGARGSASDRDYRDLEDRIRLLIEEVHRLAWQMRPSILDDYGLERAVERYVEETCKKSGLAIDFQQISADGLDRLPHWIETTLYRVAQEGVTNLVRHSQATQASVVLIRKRSNVTLLIEDNGIGFDPRDVEPTSSRGLGLLGMKERVTECGGTLEVESAPLKGTTIRVQIPLGQNLKWQSV